MQTENVLPVPKPRVSPVARVLKQAVAPFLVLLVLAAAAWIATSQVTTPPAVVPASAPASDFSGERAMTELRAIAAEPHTVGSPAQARVREYILGRIQAMGLAPVVQDATAALPDEAGIFASSLHNILVRIPGADSTGAVAVMAHYDSQPNTTGASDNGAAVAGILESMRAVQAGPRLRNDLIFVLTDAEEVDAQGADAFFHQHPWARDIRLLVNFEAAGDTGASLLLETSPGNRGLAEGFVQAVPHPVAQSFLTQLLGIMPLGTDMTVFAENGVPSLSPMFGWHYHTMYHSLLDNPEAVDPGSVQQQGENALGLARYFGNQDLAALNTREDAVFFTLLPGVVVRYPAGWAAPLALLAALLLAIVLAIGLRRRQLTIGGILAGLGLALAGVLVSVVVAAAAWMAIAQLHPEAWRQLMGAPYQADLYLLGFVALVVAVHLAIVVLARRRVSPRHLTVGSLVIWLALAVVTALNLPGMSYFFTWPVLVTGLVLGGLVMRPEGEQPAPTSWARLGGVALAGAAVLLVVVPVIILLYLLLGFWFLTMQPGLPFIAASMLFVALTLGLLVPQIDRLTRSRKWLAPGVAGLIAVGCLAGASLLSGFSPSQPMPNGVWYEVNADTGQAAWTSFGERPEDPWTAQFFPGAIMAVAPDELYAALAGNPTPAHAYQGAAPVAALPAPELAVVSDNTAGDVRTLALHLRSPRLARGLRLQASGAPVLAAAVNGNRQTDPGWAAANDWHLRYYGLSGQGLDLVLEVKAGQPLTLTVSDQSDGLPELPGVTYTPRGPDMMPFAMAQEYMPYPETTSVSKTFRLQ